MLRFSYKLITCNLIHFAIHCFLIEFANVNFHVHSAAKDEVSNCTKCERTWDYIKHQIKSIKLRENYAAYVCMKQKGNGKVFSKQKCKTVFYNVLYKVVICLLGEIEPIKPCEVEGFCPDIPKNSPKFEPTPPPKVNSEDEGEPESGESTQECIDAISEQEKHIGQIDKTPGLLLCPVLGCADEEDCWSDVCTSLLDGYSVKNFVFSKLKDCWSKRIFASDVCMDTTRMPDALPPSSPPPAAITFTDENPSHSNSSTSLVQKVVDSESTSVQSVTVSAVPPLMTRYDICSLLFCFTIISLFYYYY